MIIKKQITSTAVRRSIAMLLILFSVSGVSPIHAAGDFFGGILIKATPFDFKLSEAGFSNYEAPAEFPKAESLDNLFLQARSFRYAPDDRGDHWQSPAETEIKRSGDCEDKAIWLYAQLKRNGYSNVRLVVGKHRNFDRKFHVWVVCTDGLNKVYLLDPAIQKRVWTKESFSSGFYQPVYSFDGRNRYRYVAS